MSTTSTNFSQSYYFETPLSFLSANESQRKVGRTFLVETDAKYRVEQTPEKNSDMLCEESV